MAHTPRQQIYNPLTGSGFNLVPQDLAQVVTVGKSGAMFTDIQDAIDSISDANSLTKPYEIITCPGTYTKNLVLKDGVFLTNGITATVFIVGKITSTGTSGIKGISVSYAPIADNEIIVDVSGTRFSLTDVTVSAIGSGDFICTGVKSSCTSFASTNTTVADVRSATITKNVIGWDLIGTGTVTLFNLAVSMRGNYSAGTHSLIRNGTTGRITISGGSLFFTDTIGTFAGEVRGFSTVAANTSGAINGLSMRLTGISGGTATAFHSDGAGANLLQTNCVAVINGFTTMNITDTAAADTQKVMQCTMNRPLTQAGAGVSIVTPKAEEHCGFIAFAGSGAAYSYVVGTRVFTLLRAGSGLIKSVPVSWAANQTVTLTDYATNYVYIDGNGAIGTNTSSTGLSDTTIILFEVYSDGTAYVVAKENHGANFQEKTSTYLHKSNGPLLENNGGATIGTLVAASRTVNLTGACTLLDHGLETTIPDSAATALTFRVVYVAASGLTQLSTPTTAAPLFWNNGTAATALTGTQRANMRVGVLKDDINSANPTYIIQLDATGTYASNASAANAIAAGNVSAFSAQLRTLEIVQLGFITVTNAAGGSIVAVTPAKQVANQTYAGGSTAAGAAITLDTTNFNGELSGAESTVQLLADRLDDYNSVLDWGTAKTYRIGNFVRVTTEGFVGQWRCVTAHTASAALTTDINLGYWEIVSNSEGSRELINAVAHGFVAGDVLYSNAGTYTKAKAATAAASEVIGVVVGATTNYFVLAKTGKITKTGWGLTVGGIYYLSAATDGLITATEPGVTAYSVRIGVAVSATQLQLNIGRWRSYVGTAALGKIIYAATTGFNINNGALTVADSGSFSAGLSSLTTASQHNIIGIEGTLGSNPLLILTALTDATNNPKLYFGIDISGGNCWLASVKTGVGVGTGLRFGAFNVDVGGYASTGGWVLGASSGTALHTLNTAALTTSTAAGVSYLQIIINGVTRRIPTYDNA
jgi:hypothetical protein